MDKSALILVKLPNLEVKSLKRVKIWKVVGWSARDNPERYCGWFRVHWFSKKFERIAREATDIFLHLLKESNKVGSTATLPGTGYWSYPILPFGIVACTFLTTTVLEIAVLTMVSFVMLSTFITLSHSLLFVCSSISYINYFSVKLYPDIFIYGIIVWSNFP